MAAVAADPGAAAPAAAVEAASGAATTAATAVVLDPALEDAADARFSITPPSTQGMVCAALTNEVFELFERRMDGLIAGTLRNDVREVFTRTQLPAFVTTILRHKYPVSGASDVPTTTAPEPPRAAAFLERVTRYFYELLGRHETPIDKEMRRIMWQLTILDSSADAFWNTYRLSLAPKTKEEIPIAGGWGVRFPIPRGCSAFYLTIIDYFCSLGGYDRVLERLAVHTAWAVEAAPAGDGAAATPAGAAGADAGDAGAAASAAIATDTAAGASAAGAAAVASADGLASTGGSGVRSTKLSAFTDEDVVEELIMIQQYVFMPRACYTQDWAMKYYARVRDGFLARARAMTAAQVGLMGKRRIESFVNELSDLGRWLTTPPTHYGGPPHPLENQLVTLGGPAGTCTGHAAHAELMSKFLAEMTALTKK